MKQNIFTKIWKFLAASFALLALPVLARAVTITSGSNNPVVNGLNPFASLFPGSGGLNSSQDPVTFIGNVIMLLLTLAGGLAVLFLIIGGYWYITSAGNEEQAEKGRNTVVNALIGIVVIVLAFVIVNVVARFVSR